MQADSKENLTITNVADYNGRDQEKEKQQSKRTGKRNSVTNRSSGKQQVLETKVDTTKILEKINSNQTLACSSNQELQVVKSI